MINFGRLSLAVLLFVPINITASEAMSLITRGDSLFEAYDFEQSAARYDSSVALDSGSGEASWKLARSLNLFAELEPRENQLALYERAAAAAGRAVAIDSLEPEGHFQLARAYGKIALFKGVFKSVGLAKRVKKEAEITLALDSLHDGALHILGRWHREVSKKPGFIRAPLGLSAADKREGLKLMARAIELNPTLIHHRLEYGISLLNSDYEQEAREQFDICLSLPARGPLELKYQREAKENLAKLDKKD